MSWSAGPLDIPLKKSSARSFRKRHPSHLRSRCTKPFGDTFASGMRAVDTNNLVRLIVRDDASQVRDAEAFIATGAWVSHLVLAETVWVLDAVYERTAEQIGTAIDMLLNHKGSACRTPRSWLPHWNIFANFLPWAFPIASLWRLPARRATCRSALSIEILAR